MSEQSATEGQQPDGGEPPIQVNVVVDGPVDPILTKLTAAGLTVHNVLSALGIVSGEVLAGQLDGLRHVEGVLAVEEEREVEAWSELP